MISTMDSGSTLICPHCKKSIELSQAMMHQFEERLEKEVSEKLEKSQKELEEKLTKELSQKSSKEKEELERELSEQKKKNEEFVQKELELRTQARKLEDAKKEFELTLQRKMDEERKSLEEKIIKAEEEKFRFRELEKNKTIDDLKRALEDAQRKASLTSQQLQGEVLELDLQNMLIETFPNDDIEEIKKGSTGADIRQTVRTPKGTICGVILWETKRAKSFDGDWPEKLKSDLRAEKANIPIIVSTVMPKDFKSDMGIKEGVWVVSFSLSATLAELMRQRLIDVAREKFLAQNKDGKSEALYEYITSHEFVQQIESFLEVHREMIDQVNREKAAFEKQWKARVEYSEKLMKSAARMVGSIQGRLGSSTTLQIKGMDMLDSGE